MKEIMKNLLIAPMLSSVFGIVFGFGVSNLMFGKTFFENPGNLYYAFLGVVMFMFNFWSQNRSKTITVSE